MALTQGQNVELGNIVHRPSSILKHCKLNMHNSPALFLY